MFWSRNNSARERLRIPNQGRKFLFTTAVRGFNTYVRKPSVVNLASNRIGFPVTSSGGRILHVCSTDAIIMNRAASAKWRPGQILKWKLAFACEQVRKRLASCQNQKLLTSGRNRPTYHETELHVSLERTHVALDRHSHPSWCAWERFVGWNY